MSTIQELCPSYFGAEFLKLTAADPLAQPQAHRPTTVLIDASGCEPAGLVLPIEVIVTGPSRRSFIRHTDFRIVRSSFTFTPREGGRHTVVMRELAHNRWCGRVDLDVLGDKLDTSSP